MTALGPKGNTAIAAERRDVLTTNVTIIQLQSEFLRRQLERRPDLSETDRRWLETALATSERATQAITSLIVDDGAFAHTQWVSDMPMQR